MANLSAEQTLSANLPAPKTFAPSREDVLSTLGFFFGDPGTLTRMFAPCLSLHSESFTYIVKRALSCSQPSRRSSRTTPSTMR